MTLTSCPDGVDFSHQPAPEAYGSEFKSKRRPASAQSCPEPAGGTRPGIPVSRLNPGSRCIFFFFWLASALSFCCDRDQSINELRASSPHPTTTIPTIPEFRLLSVSDKGRLVMGSSAAHKVNLPPLSLKLSRSSMGDRLS